MVRESLNTANNVLADSAPRLAEELVDLALDRKNKAYARTAAIGECFRIMNTNLIEQQQRKQMAQIREHLAALEEGTGPDVIDV